MIPIILKLRVKDKDNKRFGIWLPLFLLWLVILPLLVLPVPIILLVALILWPSGKGQLVLYSYIAIFELIFNLSGLKVDVESKEGSLIYINLR